VRRVGALVAVAVFGVSVAACGADDDDGAASSSTETIIAGDFNDADVEFARSMIPHHRQAVEMAVIALDGPVKAGVEVRDLASRIEQAQGPEIEQLTGWLDVWKQDTAEEPAGTGAMGEMGGMMTDEAMSSLSEMRGDSFDRRWMEMMIRHHRGAVRMAEAEVRDGLNPDAVELAGQIVAAQQAEIAEMRTFLRT